MVRYPFERLDLRLARRRPERKTRLIYRSGRFFTDDFGAADGEGESRRTALIRAFGG